MNNTPAQTTGQAMTAELRRYFSTGPRTRRSRKGQDLHLSMVEAIEYAATAPGYYSERTQNLLRPGFGAAVSYRKHVRGYRIDGVLAYQINSMTAWQFAGLLGQMVDAGVNNTGEGERFFSFQAQQLAA